MPSLQIAVEVREEVPPKDGGSFLGPNRHPNMGEHCGSTGFNVIQLLVGRKLIRADPYRFKSEREAERKLFFT